MLYCVWITLNSFFYLSSEDIYLNFGVSLLISFTTASQLFCWEFSDVPSLYYFYQFINNFLSFFWRYICFFRYFFIMLIVTVSELFCCKFFENCNFISNFITNQITSCFCRFWNYSFGRSYMCICCRFLALSRSFWLYLPLVFAYIFTHIFS